MEINIRKIDYKLGKESQLFKVLVLNQIHQLLLKSMIQRFATREASAIRKGNAFYLWRVRRLRAAEIYEKRFGGVPTLFKSRKLPALRSYYINNGVYVWPRPRPSEFQSGARKN